MVWSSYAPRAHQLPEELRTDLMCLWTQEMGWGDASASNSWQAGELQGAHLSLIRAGCRVAIGPVIPASPTRAHCRQRELQELIGGTL